LPSSYPSLQILMPELTPRHVRARLLAHISTDNVDDADEMVLGKLLEVVDTPTERVHLADAVNDLREQGQIDAKVAAAALYELGSDSQALLAASVRSAVAAKASEIRTLHAARLERERIEAELGVLRVPDSRPVSF